jgi:GTPase-associated protein 1, C-terminal domain
VVTIFAAGLDDITGQYPGLVPEELQETALLAHAAKHPQDRVADLHHFLTRHRRQLDAGLLGRIWPEGHWTAAEARSVAHTFAEDRLLAEPIHSWLVRAVISPPAGHGYLEPYAQLCELLETRRLGRTLPEAAIRQLDAFLSTKRLVEQAHSLEGKARAQAIQRLATSYAGLDQPARELSQQALLDLIDQLAGSRELPVVVEACPPPVVAFYLRSAQQRLGVTPRDVAAAARLFTTLAALSGNDDQVLAPGLERTLGEELKLWRRQDLNAVAEMLHQLDGRTADGFADWRQRRLSTGLRRSWRRLVTGHAEGGP